MVGPWAGAQGRGTPAGNGCTSPALLFPEYRLPVCAGWTLPSGATASAVDQTPSAVAQAPCGLAKGRSYVLWFPPVQNWLGHGHSTRESPGLGGTSALSVSGLWCHCVLLPLPIPSVLPAGGTFCARDALGTSVPSPPLSQLVQHLVPGCGGLLSPPPRLSSLQGVQEHRGAEDKDCFRHHRSPRGPRRKGQKGARG